MSTETDRLVSGLIHAETQLHADWVDLTVEQVFRVDQPAHVDFGGSELQRPATTPIEPERRHPEDEYGWWELEAGTYLVSYNETLERPPAFLQPRDILRIGGASHPAGWVSELDLVGLHVGCGLDIKENARISTLWPSAPQ